MRMIGFAGIFLLSLLNMLCMFFAIQSRDWKGIAVMTFMAGLLVFFTRTLWRGRRLERAPRPHGEADDWAHRSVSRFFTDQVARSPEGLILLAGSAVSLLLAIAALAWPTILALPVAQVGKAAATFLLWPVIALVIYVQVCGPDYRSSVYKRIVMLAVMCGPMFVLYR